MREEFGIDAHALAPPEHLVHCVLINPTRR